MTQFDLFKVCAEDARAFFKSQVIDSSCIPFDYCPHLEILDSSHESIDELLDSDLPF